mmetsp:Transcript_12508/g.16833  ORF Transcript_12508/g.16833 Transcript_12508/m.16833 type:complete len:216 (-) Transcript_12508:746-1393(-)
MWNKITIATILAWPFISRVLYKTDAWIHGPTYRYMEGECLLKMVNESAPDHFVKHPLWKYRGYSSNCDVVEYFNVQQQNQAEFKVVFAYLGIGALLCLMSLMHKPPKYTIAHIILGLLTWSMIFVTTHYQHENLHLNGNIMHHSNLKHDGKNASLVKTIGHGVLYSILSTHAIILLTMRLILRWHLNHLSFFDFIRIQLPCQALKIIWNLRFVHS